MSAHTGMNLCNFEMVLGYDTWSWQHNILEENFDKKSIVDMQCIGYVQPKSVVCTLHQIVKVKGICGSK